MAIVPQRENFAVMPQGFSARMSTAPALADAAGKARAAGQALMAYAQAADERDQVGAAEDVNALAGFLDEKQASLFARKGIHAWQDEDGAPVMAGLNREVESEVRSLRRQLGEKEEVIDILKKSVGILSKP